MSQGSSGGPTNGSTSAVPSATLLVVEDDPTINQAVTDRLVAEGFRVVQAFDGPSAVLAHHDSSPDLVVLDLMLPGFDGLEVCRRIQAARPVPVLMLTARADETDLLVGLGVGADDYVTKPFRMREVVARIRALLRRVDRARDLAAAQPALVELGDLVVDRAARRVVVADVEVHLTPLEFDLLLALAVDPGAVRSREDLMREVWGWADARGTRTLDSHVKALRAKVGADRVRTVHGVGYAVEPGAPGGPRHPEGPGGRG
jgi:DNA-binding response OmpR family regulator